MPRENPPSRPNSRRRYRPGTRSLVVTLLAVGLTLGAAPVLVSSASAEDEPPLTALQQVSVNEVAADDAELTRVNILVSRGGSGELDLVAMVAVDNPGEDRVVVDPNGETYDGDLDDFRRENSLFSQEDQIRVDSGLFSRSEPADETLSVSGALPPDRTAWYAGGAVVLAGALAFGITRYLNGRRLARSLEEMRAQPVSGGSGPAT
ncbi:hypothetical protein [Streptomyces otsuchiensis]|uniref:hypothetical protein n=1 Tax=Streptomyces otsuchiensis TaxID=2681388 RepID=UPI00102F7898|nr:hypothetical protein [Streptomyces otsuchiensis]